MTEIDINKLVYILPKSELNKCLLDDSDYESEIKLNSDASNYNSEIKIIKYELLDSLINNLDEYIRSHV